jgi:hypothetical protein
VTSAQIEASRGLWAALERDMKRGRLGFFLADLDGKRRAFRLREWRSLGPQALDERDDLHATLTDEAQADVIKWAWDAGASLVEAHTHGPFATASFSPLDLANLGDWVPHLWWRLRGRPYGALVIAGDTLDALAWLDDPRTAVPVSALIVNGGNALVPTGLTVTSLRRSAQRGDGR